MLILVQVVLGVELVVCTCHGRQWPKKEGAVEWSKAEVW